MIFGSPRGNSIGRRMAASSWQESANRLARQQPAGLYLLPVAGGTPRRLTTPKVVTDQAPAFSRDGRRLAYASCIASIVSACDVYVLDLDTAFTPVGQARRLTSQGAAISGLTWSRNGQSIIYDAQAVPGLAYLWSVDVAGHDQPVRIEVAGVRASEPATTSAMDRLVFSRSLLNLDVYEMAWGHPPQPVAASSFDDFLARFSPDGRQIVFCSTRSGESFELWIASADGSGARQLTRGLGRARARESGRQMANRSHSTLWARTGGFTSGSSIPTVEHRGRSPRIPAVSGGPPGLTMGNGSTTGFNSQTMATSGARVCRTVSRSS